MAGTFLSSLTARISVFSLVTLLMFWQGHLSAVWVMDLSLGRELSFSWGDISKHLFIPSRSLMANQINHSIQV